MLQRIFSSKTATSGSFYSFAGQLKREKVCLQFLHHNHDFHCHPLSLELQGRRVMQALSSPNSIVPLPVFRAMAFRGLRRRSVTTRKSGLLLSNHSSEKLQTNLEAQNLKTEEPLVQNLIQLLSIWISFCRHCHKMLLIMPTASWKCTQKNWIVWYQLLSFPPQTYLIECTPSIRSLMINWKHIQGSQVHS